jgi:phage tail tape-measure protein
MSLRSHRNLTEMRRMNVGGKIMHVRHINHHAVEFKKLGSNKVLVHHRRFKKVYGGGFWDTISSIASNPIVQKLGSFAVDQGIKRLGGKASGSKKIMSREKLLNDIEHSMSGRRRKR